MPLYDVTVTARFVYTAVETDTEELAMELIRADMDDMLGHDYIKPDMEFSAVERS